MLGEMDNVVEVKELEPGVEKSKESDVQNYESLAAEKKKISNASDTIIHEREGSKKLKKRKKKSAEDVGGEIAGGSREIEAEVRGEKIKESGAQHKQTQLTETKISNSSDKIVDKLKGLDKLKKRKRKKAEVEGAEFTGESRETEAVIIRGAQSVATADFSVESDVQHKQKTSNSSYEIVDVTGGSQKLKKKKSAGISDETEGLVKSKNAETDNEPDVSKKLKKSKKKNMLIVDETEFSKKSGLSGRLVDGTEGSNILKENAEAVDEVEGSKKSKKRKKDTVIADETVGTKKLKTKAPASNEKRKSRKKVTFSDHVEVANLPEFLQQRKLNSEGDFIQGRRYTPEEDAKIFMAIDDFIVKRGLADDVVNKDLDENWKKARDMVMNCGAHPEIKDCWKEITQAIPWRTMESVYQRAHTVYERSEDRKWTNEELETVRSFHEKHGPKWRLLADVLGKSRKHVKDAYRRVRFSHANKGAWSQEEYQKLFDLVNADTRIRANQEKKLKHGMLRDNIAWGAIADKIATRASPTCCSKWYYQMSSAMVLEGKWTTTDDCRLVDALYNLDACCIEDVDWDSLLEHRPGDLCRQRWTEMARFLGEHRQKPFSEQVEVLYQRYDPDLIEPMETYEKKVPVDAKSVAT